MERKEDYLEMIKAKVMELQVVDVDLATGWRDEGTAGCCEEQPKAKAAQTRLIFINPTTPLPYFLIVTIIAIPKLYIFQNLRDHFGTQLLPPNLMHKF